MWPKLDGLERLQKLQTKTFGTLPFVVFDVSEWKTGREHVLERVQRATLGHMLAVRSCVGMEDAIEREPPGFFDSVLNVSATVTALSDAVDKVMMSYARRLSPSPVADKIIIQQQLLGATMCGVFRVSPDATDYIEIDYDETSGRTNTVTSGAASKRASASPRVAALPAPWAQIRKCADELRDQFSPPFFVEFALDQNGQPTVLQIRSDRRVAAIRPPIGRSQGLSDVAEIIHRFGPMSVMTDWNPAEILGVRPLPLDVSLYDEILMKSAWSEGRASVGWARPEDTNLLAVVAGRPYVKIRQSIQSLLPAGLEPGTAARLVSNRLERLRIAKHLHDKVEFRIMWSAFAFDPKALHQELIADGITEQDVECLFDGLKSVTRAAIDNAPGLLASDRTGIEQLNCARAALVKMDAREAELSAIANCIHEALRACVLYGTIPFSRQARLAFTFRFIINHLVEAGQLHNTDIARWESGLNTVARQLSRDLKQAVSNESARAALLQRYGHLRPSTYDLESPRYDERSMPAADMQQAKDVPYWMPGPCPRLEEILADVGTSRRQSEFWQAAAGAYQGREEMKFHFSAVLSDTLRALAQCADLAGIAKGQLRRVPILNLLTLMDRAQSWRTFAAAVQDFDVGAEWAFHGPELPDVLWEVDALDLIMELPLRPTFVGDRTVVGRPHLITKESSAKSGELAGAVVIAETADPGYDWLFGHRFTGLITAYGGEFSHMGLRCGEFGIPAVLGCGSTAFHRVSRANQLTLDPIRREVWADGQRLFPT